jgi:predicted membrane channel-forming protein YqfA (hemolysin III family)
MSAEKQQAVNAEFDTLCECSLGQRNYLSDMQVPEYMRSKGITGSYRPVSCLHCAAVSVFAAHNETVNIWSHVLGTLICVLAFSKCMSCY